MKPIHPFETTCATGRADASIPQWAARKRRTFLGFQFSLEHANWLTHTLQHTGPAPVFAYEFEAHPTLRKLLETALTAFRAAAAAGRFVGH